MTDIPAGGFSQPGARSSRQENIETEVKMPVLQAGVRSLTDIVACLLVLLALGILGRWVIWFAIGIFFFSEYYDRVVDAVISRVYGLAATVLDIGALLLKWSWLFLGYLVVRLFFPITWTMEEMLWQRSILEPGWPFVHSAAVPWGLPVGLGLRLFLLLVCVAPLFTWRSLRDRMKWSIEEFTPFGPINAAEMGIDPRKWGPRDAAPPPNNEMGVIFEKTDYEPHTERLAEGVFISNGTGRSAVRIDMRWVTEEQWVAVAQALVVDRQPFSEETLGRGRVFPTHGPYSENYGANLGFRFFRAQMIEAGRATLRGNHENSGVDLTPAGIDFLRRRFLDGAIKMEDDDDGI